VQKVKEWKKMGRIKMGGERILVMEPELGEIEQECGAFELGADDILRSVMGL
jgi:hypothetical protein